MSALAAAGARSRPRSPRFRSQGSRSRRSPRTSHPHAGPGRPWPGVFSKCGSPSAAAMATAYSLPRPGPSCPLPLPHALPSRWPPRPSRRRVPRLLLLLVSLPARLSFWVLENPKRQQQNSFVPLPVDFACYTQFDRCAFRASPQRSNFGKKSEMLLIVTGDREIAVRCRNAVVIWHHLPSG